MKDTDDTRRTTYDRSRTMLGVWHKLPTGELKKKRKGRVGGKKMEGLSSSSRGKLKTFHPAV